MFLRFARKTKVKDLEVGREAVIEGKVVAKKTLKLPSSSTQCVYYDVLNEVYKRGDRGAGRKLWMVKDAEQKLEGFYLEDETGRVLVTADGPEVKLSGAPTEAAHVGKKGTLRYTARLIQNGFTLRIRGRVGERQLSKKQTVLVLGPGKKGCLEVLVRSTKE